MLRILALASVSILTACATVQPPIVDIKGADPVRYQTDLAECDALANQAKRPGGLTEIMGVNDSMHQVTIRMCLVHRGYKVVG